jgi:hypothetical protein
MQQIGGVNVLFIAGFGPIVHEANASRRVGIAGRSREETLRVSFLGYCEPRSIFLTARA